MKRIASDSEAERTSDDDNGIGGHVNLRIKKKKTKNQLEYKAVIVLDLDETLINGNCNHFPDLEFFLQKIRKLSNRLILWTAGNTVHASTFLQELGNTYQSLNSKIFDHRK